VIDVFSPKDISQTSARGRRKKTINQKLPGTASNQKTAGFLRQLSKIKNPAARAAQKAGGQGRPPESQ
jgi:hypothetical protein